MKAKKLKQIIELVQMLTGVPDPLVAERVRQVVDGGKKEKNVKVPRPSQVGV